MIRLVDVTESDKRSAQVFFTALAQIYDLGHKKILDAFARNGQLTVSSYRPYINPHNLECWELEEAHKEALDKITPHVQIGDSYVFAEVASLIGKKFDVVVIDTPQGIHKDSSGLEHVEHFDFIRKVISLLNKDSIVVLYVNKNPYNKELVGDHGYDKYEEYNYKTWMEKRYKFYGSSIITEDMAIEKYRNFFEAHGFKVNSILQTPCFSDVEGLHPYSFRLALDLTIR